MPALRPNASSATAVLVERGGRFFVYEPGLGVIASDDNAAKAYDKFVNARRTFLDDLELAGLSLVPASAVASATRADRGVVVELGLFIAKSCIVVAIIAVLGLTAADQAARAVNRVALGAAQSVDQALAPLKSASLADVVRKAADIARDAEELPAEKKEALRRSIAAISLETAPFVDAWHNPAQVLSPTQLPSDGTRR